MSDATPEKRDSEQPPGSTSGRRRRKKHHRSNNSGGGGGGDDNDGGRGDGGKALLVVPSKQGWLTKRGKVVKNWKKRWFVCRDGAMSYFKEPSSGGTPTGEFPLTDAVAQECAARVGKHHAFEVITRARTYFLVADSAEEMESWLATIRHNVTTVRAMGEVTAADCPGGNEVFIKTLVVGESGVGKTQLVRRWDGKSFEKKYQETEGTPFARSQASFEGWMAHICVYDIPGATRMLDNYWRGVAALVACFDITNQTSFGKAKKIVREVIDNCPNCVPIIVGTKADLDSERTVDEEAAETFAHEAGGVYVEVSAKSNRDCDKPFFHILKGMSTLRRWGTLPVSADAVLL